MLTNSQILDMFNINSIIKKYPKSGQKQVFLVEDKDSQHVILKLVEGKSERIKREIEIVTENNFANVPSIKKIDMYSYDGQKGIYIIEEYIEGVVLSDLIRDSKLSILEGIKLAEDILNVIVQLEEKMIVHRDIKPDNIIKSVEGDWYLIDFGIARAMNMESLTMTEMKVGPHTPGYGAPELFQYNKNDIDSRADIFSLGVVLYQAIIGNHPFLRGDEWDRNEVWYRTVTVCPQDIIIEGDVDMLFIGLIQTFMQKHISRRPNSAIKAKNWLDGVKETIMGEV
ncbi:MAG: serine/threonine protein kinase [Clostridia bacterium]|nr:serine/threonine protein kinase [Clostridia bacterium]